MATACGIAVAMYVPSLLADDTTATENKGSTRLKRALTETAVAAGSILTECVAPRMRAPRVALHSFLCCLCLRRPFSEKGHLPGQRTLTSSEAFDPVASRGLQKTLSEGVVLISEPWSEKGHTPGQRTILSADKHNAP